MSVRGYEEAFNLLKMLDFIELVNDKRELTFFFDNKLKLWFESFIHERMIEVLGDDNLTKEQMDKLVFWLFMFCRKPEQVPGLFK
jgi:hypothetical protein